MAERGHIFARLEHDQWDFARERARSFHGAIVAAKHLAPYPPTHPSAGQDHERLAKAVVDARRALVVDPGTPALTSRAVMRYPSAARLRATAAATAVALPLTVEQLHDESLRDGFVDGCMLDQCLARAVAAPYLEARSQGDARHAVNLQMLRRVLRSAGAQVPVAFIQVTRDRLLRGLLSELASDYSANGVERVFIRVRGVGEDASAIEFRAYLEALDAFTACAIDVVPDCVGRLGPLLVHEGAIGFSTGTMFFRTVAAPLLAKGGGAGGASVSIESSDGWCEIPRDSDQVATMEPCPEPGCRAGTPYAELDDLREHRLHTLARLAREAAERDTGDLIRSLRSSGQARAREQAEVLAERHRRVA